MRRRNVERNLKPLICDMERRIVVMKLTDYKREIPAGCGNVPESLGDGIK